MKKSGFVAVFLLASLAVLRAQVTVEVTLSQQQFLPGESLVAIVRVINRSGQTLHLGADNNWLTFAVERHDGAIVSRSGEIPVKGEFTLESSQRATKRVDIAPYFNLGRLGTYTITATIAIPEWSQQVSSDPASFDMIEAAKLWEQDFGVPLPSGVTNRPSEVRHYALEQANYLKHLMLYVQVNDAMGRLNKVFPLGPMLSFGQPDPQVDKFSNLHVLYQDGPHAFSYVVINPDGDLLLRRTYEYTTRPRLQPDGNGDYVVVGGLRRVAASDIPPPRTEDILSNQK